MQDENFNKALTAMKMARKNHKEVVFYDKLDIYKLLLNTMVKLNIYNGTNYGDSYHFLLFF